MRCGRRSARLRIMFGSGRKGVNNKAIGSMSCCGIFKLDRKWLATLYKAASELGSQTFRWHLGQLRRDKPSIISHLSCLVSEPLCASTRLEIVFIQIVGKCVIDSLHRGLTIFSLSNCRCFWSSFWVFFRRQWKSISMFWCFHLLCLSRSHSGTTPCCVLDKTMIMFYENEISSRDSRI